MSEVRTKYQLSESRVLAGAGAVEVVAWDFLGPFTPVGDYRYLLVVVDYATRWCEVTPVAAADHHHVMIMLSAVCARFGIPRICLSDRVMAFKEQNLQQTARNLEIGWVCSPAYSPQSIGLVEGTNLELPDLA